MQRKRSKAPLFVGLFLITTSIILIIYWFYSNQSEMKLENNSILEYIEETSQEEILNNEEDEESSSKSESISYNMILEIESIDLKKGLYDLTSNYNDVDYGLEMLEISNMPSINNSVLVIASHSGNSSISYFKNLYKLKKNDVASIYYEGIKYNYELADIIEVDKTGTIEMDLDRTNNVLILITCKKNTDKQYVFIFYLSDIESY
ncbi:MAG: sortase [Mycoplasmatota bacterium]